MICHFYHSTIGKKILVALTGVILFGFVVGHMLGNLQVFAGAQKINDYAAFLKANPPILWGTRIILLLSVFIHILMIVQLTIRNRQARPQAYTKRNFLEADWASRFMVVSGAVLFLYIIFHLLHLTTGTAHPQFSHTNVYRNLVVGLSSVPTAGFYLLAMAALGFHLYHGIWSVFQTLGLNHPKYNKARRVFAIGAAVVVALGYMSIPAAILLKVVK